MSISPELGSSAAPSSSPEKWPNAIVGPNDLELSVVIPCLNEARTLERCIRAARAALDHHGICGEIIVADNGSTDASIQIAERYGAQVVPVSAKGYGNALRAGIDAARGQFIVMGDGDDSYDFGELCRFLGPLRKGYDLVMGNRFRGAILPGAMPWKNRYLGNPVLSGVGHAFFGSGCGDFHCGLRAFRRSVFLNMAVGTPGMEFASEMVIHAILRGLHITEVPVTLRCDGRQRPSHLRPWRDGWQHLRLMLLYSPRWLFFYPGILSLGLGLALLMLGLAQSPPPESHLTGAGFLALGGLQVIGLSLIGKQFTIQQGLHPPNRRLGRLLRYCRMEWGLLGGLPLTAAGAAGLAIAVLYRPEAADCPGLAHGWIVAAGCVFLLGLQTTFLACFASLLGLKNTRVAPES